MTDIDKQQQKVAEFIRLLPLTLSIAGLPPGATGTHFSEGQLEARATTLRIAYKIARQVILEVASAEK